MKSFYTRALILIFFSIAPLSASIENLDRLDGIKWAFTGNMPNEIQQLSTINKGLTTKLQEALNRMENILSEIQQLSAINKDLHARIQPILNPKGVFLTDRQYIAMWLYSLSACGLLAYGAVIYFR